jgi:hypothetical protein
MIALGCKGNRVRPIDIAVVVNVVVAVPFQLGPVSSFDAECITFLLCTKLV